jgi:hypothetical protein
MGTIVKGGLLIAILCGCWQIVMGLTGWYKDPVMMSAFFLVILIQIAVMFWGLRKTAPGRGYGGQIGAGVLMSLVAGILIIGISFLFTTVLYPHYFEEMRIVAQQQLQAQGVDEAEAMARIRAAEQYQTPLITALQGFAGTMLTGAVVSAVIAIFYRKKSA